MRTASSLALFCLLLTILLIGYNLQLQKKLIFRENETGMAGILGSVEADIRRAVFGLDQVFNGLENYLAHCAPADLHNRQDLRRILDDLVAHNNYLVGVNIIDANGDVIQGNGDIVRPNLRQRDYFSVHTAGVVEGLYIGPPHPSLIYQDQWTTGISKALRHPDGSLDKVLLGVIDLEYFFQSYREYVTEPGLTLTILSPAGLIYSRIPDHRSAVGQQHPDLAGDGSMAEKIPLDGGTYMKNTDGISEAVIFRQIADLPFIIRLTRSEDAILAPWRPTERILVSLGIVISVVLLYFALFAINAQRKQQATMEMLRVQSTTDELTRLHNRRHFLEEAQLETKKALRSNLPLSLIMIDLDHFKDINDHFGHHTGDMVLRDCAGLLKNSCRETDLVGRLGGEEFVLLLPATDLGGALAIAEKIRLAIGRQRFTGQQETFSITASLGVAQLQQPQESFAGALKRADSLLYEAKNAGRNTIRPRFPEEEPG